MGFSLEVVGDDKKKIIGRSHIKYVDNVGKKLKPMIWMERSRKIRRFKKKMALKTDFKCESYALTFTNKFIYEVTHFYKKKRGSLLQ
jgi:hypothetical protein